MTTKIEHSASQLAAAANVKNIWGGIIYNVKAYGAKGGGVTDDTTAIQAAISAAESAGGGKVLFPSGTYLVTTALDITGSGVVLEGVDRSASVISVPATFPTNVNGVFVFSGGVPGPTIRRLSIIFAQVDTAVRGDLIAFPPAIYAVARSRFRIKECRISKAMVGIEMTGNSGGSLIEDLEMSALDTGINIDGSLDSTRIDKLHFWPFDLTANQTTIFYDTSCYGIQSGRCDDLHLSNSLFISGVGARFYESASGDTFGTITSVDFDAHASLEVEAGTISVSGGFMSMANDSQRGIIHTGGILNLTAINFNIAASLTNPVISMVGSGASSSMTVLSLNGCVFSSLNYDCEHIFASTGGKIIIMGCQFRKSSSTVYTKSIIKVDASVRATVIGNGISDKGTGAGTFIEITQDNFHRVVYNASLGWTITTPAPTQGIYTPN